MKLIFELDNRTARIIKFLLFAFSGNDNFVSAKPNDKTIEVISSSDRIILD